MILGALGTIFSLFIGFIILIILIPVVLAMFFFFYLKSKKKATKTFSDFLKSTFQKFTSPSKSSTPKPVTDSKGNKIEDAEYREVE